MRPLSWYKKLFYVIGFLGVISFFLPSFIAYVHFANGESFSELYFLGPSHMASDYPFNVTQNDNYSIYMGVVNHVNSAAYYEVEVKLGNPSDSLPNVTAGLNSSLPTLYEERIFLADGNTWENQLNFSFTNVAFNGNISVSVGEIRINDAIVNVQKMTAWDNSSNGFYFRFFAELWKYDANSGKIAFDNKFVNLWLNMTEP